ncbi:MAG: NBR1-Ig-like domain-containing protein [Anaerolineae bacterium]|jgi:hypothetical protein|nr:NBR1-Ig-like domain-containing protein [Anaerolineae bacterium]
MADELQSTAASGNQETPSIQPEAAPISIANLGNGKPGKSSSGVPLPRLGSAFQGRNWIVFAVVGVLFILFLFLPPVSLASRLGAGGGYETLNAKTPTLTHPDGLTVSMDPEVVERLRVKLDSVPRAEFLGEDAPKELEEAKTALPPYLSVKSPYYTIDVKGNVTGPAELSMVIPNEAEPWETLDLYAWDGTAWQWVPSSLDRDKELLVSQMDTLPGSLVVVQTGMVQQAIVAEDDDLPPTEVNGTLTQVDLVGIKIGTLGEVTGDPSLLPPGTASTKPLLAPSVRNWVTGRPANRGLVVDMLSIESDRKAHITNLTTLIQNGGYSGLVLDYRSLNAEDRDLYAGFVSELAAALHENNAWLAVTVDTPVQQADGTWDTLGFDWRALGAAADQLRVVMPLDPQAYTPGGVAEQLVVWGTSQVSRYKLYPVFSTLSTDGQGTLTIEDLLGSLGEVRISQGITDSVTPGTALGLQFASQSSVETDALTSATRVNFVDRTCWLGTPEWLRSRLDLSARYHLGGVVLRDLLDGGNLPGMVDAVQQYTAQTAAVTTATAPQVTWRITDPSGIVSETLSSLVEPQFVWIAPQITGTYKIAASVLGTDHGAVEIRVGDSAAVAEEGEDGEAESTAATVSTVEGLRASYADDITVPDNTKFDNNEKFTKTWRVRNSGSVAWPKNTVLTFVSGKQMASVSEVKVGSVEPGDEIDISVDMVAPNENGTFQAEWALSTEGSLIPNSNLWVVIVAGEETAAATPAPAVAPVAGGSFELGGHILNGFAYADKMHYAGMNWAKVQVRYPSSSASGIIAAAHASGFKIQISALGAADMVTKGGFNETFASWVAGIAAAGADAIEIWNEPNLPREWQSGQISPQSYTQLLCASYSAIKAANSSVAVISAAPAPTGYFGGCFGTGCDDVPWLQGMYNAGATNCMDYIGAHHNSGATAPSATSGHPADPGSTHHSWFFLPQTQIYYNTFGGARKLFYTELGYVSPEGYGWIPGTFSWGANTTVAQQAQWLAEVVSLSSQTGMVRAVIVWNVDATCYGECGGVQDPQAGYAIIRPDGGCPACESLHALLGSR